MVESQENTKEYPVIRFNGFTEPWVQRNLSEVATITGGGTPSTSNPEYWDGDINWFAPAEIGNQTYVTESSKKISALGLQKSSAKVLPVGTILFTSRAGIGKTAILAAEASTNQGFQSIVPGDNLDSYFVYSLTDKLARYGNKMGSGSTFDEISGKQLGKYPIMLPEIEEQVNIGNLFKTLDNLIAANQRKGDKLVEIKKLLLQKMFVSREQGTPAIRFDGFTGAWVQSRLGDIYEFKYGQFNNNPDNGGEYPIYGANGIIGGYTEYNAENSAVIGHMGAYAGHVIWAEGKHFVTYNGTMAYPKVADLDKKFGFHMLQYLNIPKITAGSGQPFVSYSDLENIKIYKPTFDEQAKIGSILDWLDALIVTNQSKGEKLVEIKKLLLQQMFV